MFIDDNFILEIKLQNKSTSYKINNVRAYTLHIFYYLCMYINVGWFFLNTLNTLLFVKNF